MNIIDIIGKKRDNKPLNKQEIEFFVNGYTNNQITDYQAAALIMAIYINGLEDEELFNLTYSMAKSGDILNLSEIGDNIVDKHSTGGVGDKVSIALLPIIASLEIPVAKMSGRGLSFTGGTVDKMESIPGYRTNIEIDEFKKNIKKCGISMIGQTINLAPADKKIYALRDSINCVDNIDLIASSIMSKKIASGASKIVLEVTYGKGAFMKNLSDAKKLAKKMETIGNLASKEVKSIFTPMEEPIGYAIGNTLELVEAINFLKGEKLPEDLKNIVLEIGSYMIKLAGKGNNIEENKKKMLEKIKDKSAYNKFKEMVKNQNGDISYIENTDKFEKAKYIIKVESKNNGIVQELNAKKVGELVCYLGAGRLKKEDNIDKNVGIILNKKIGNKVKKDEILATIYANDIEKGTYAKKELERIYKLKYEDCIK